MLILDKKEKYQLRTRKQGDIQKHPQSKIDTRASTVDPRQTPALLTRRARRTRRARLPLNTNTFLQLAILPCSLCLRLRELLLRVLDRIHALRLAE
jgi:hypothetical protein